MGGKLTIWTRDGAQFDLSVRELDEQKLVVKLKK
jgi:hypothetical protein